MSKLQWLFKSDICQLYLVATEKGLQGAYFRKINAPIVQSLEGNDSRRLILRKAVQQLEEYFSGQRKEFDLSYDVDGTEFQKKVWNQLRKIPYGQTKSYRDVAHSIGNEKAVRAVGTANGRNPLSIFVPCHRVIAADGTLGGYGGGLPLKTKLLELEKAKFKY